MSMKHTIDILQEDIIIPEIVQNKADDAFARIHRDAARNTESSSASKTASVSLHSRRKHKKKLIVTFAAAALAVCTVTAGAAVYMKWSESLGKGLQVTEEQKASLESSGLADFPGLSATDAGITITSQQSIVDNYYAFLSFKVEGYSVPKGRQPGFDYVNITLDGEDAYNVGHSFYNGTIIGENGRALLADGSPIPLDEDGSLLLNYTQEDGSLEYRINIPSSEKEKGFFFNKAIHVEFYNLGLYSEARGDESLEDLAEGSWSFDWTLQGDDSTCTVECSAPLGDTGAVVTGAEISPISIKVLYDFPRTEITETGYHESQEMIDGELTNISEPFEYTYYADPPMFMGVKFKDGTLLRLFQGGGYQGYTDYENKESTLYESLYSIDRILDVDQVEALLFRKNTGSADEGESVSYKVDDYYVVNIS